MRHMEICKRSLKLHADNESTLVYYVTVDTVTNNASGIELETYGVGVTISESGETTMIPNVTLSKTAILELIELLASHLVTPVSVHDIVCDWLC